jgi:hypothetical protein
VDYTDSAEALILFKKEVLQPIISELNLRGNKGAGSQIC